MGLNILGPLELVSQGRPLKVGGPREHIVLATLAQKHQRVTSVDQLVDAVWGENPPSTARGQIQGCISALRKLFADARLPGAIKTEPAGYLLSLSDDDLDSLKFAQLVSTAREQAAAAQSAEAALTLRRALDLWRGAALQGVQSDAVRRGATVLEDARLSALEERLRLDLELGKHHAIVGELRELIVEHPLRERLYQFLMLALYRSGRQAEALDVSRLARATLLDEVGLDPGKELQDLERNILNREPSLDPPPDAGTASGNDRNGAYPRQLPRITADFIGRTAQISEITRILSESKDGGAARYAVPIIGIYGRGGVGKSTLALRVAHESAPAYPDGHLYVDLRGPLVEDRVTTLLARFLRALGVSGSAIPEDQDERAEMYRSRVANKRMLIVFDDVDSEEQVTPLLPGSPTCAVIVTSRARLDFEGARWFSIDAFDAATSTEMLARIAGTERLAAEPGAAEELAAYCGGLPLALRIAGARLASRPHWRIAELTRRMKNEVGRLDEFSYRGLELRSTIGSSYRSLSDEAKRLFRLFALNQVADFPGWTAAALLDTGRIEAEQTLERLLDVQLLDSVECPNGEIRYRFHDLIRVYAQERLIATETESERTEALGRLFGAWLSLAEHAHRAEYGGDYTTLHGSAPRFGLADWDEEVYTDAPMEWLEAERTTLVCIVRQAAVEGMDEVCWDLALTLVSLFEVKAFYDDWRDTAVVAYNAAKRASNGSGCAAMLYSLGTLDVAQKQLDEADKHFTAAQKLFEDDGNVHGQALVLRSAAFVDRMRGQFRQMLDKYDDALIKMRAVGDLIGEANILRSVAKYWIDEGDSEQASTMLADALDLCQRAGYLRGEAQVESRIAELYLANGQTVLARQTLGRVLATVRQLGDRVGEAHVLYWLGLVRRREGRMDTAEATLEQALATARQVNEILVEAQAEYALGDLYIARGDDQSASQHLTRAAALFRELGSPLSLAKTLILLSDVDDTLSPDAVGGLDEATALLDSIESKEASRLRQQLEDMRAVTAPRPDLEP